MIDLHSHVLPGIDDGARSIGESIELLELANADGVETMVLTPHIYPGRWDLEAEELEPMFDDFVQACEEYFPTMRFLLGAEVHLLPVTLKLVEQGRVPFIGALQGHPVLLLELHDGRIPPFTLSAIHHLRRRGILPMIAHPERNREVMTNPEAMEPFVRAGCLLQLTAGSVTGHFGQRAQNAAMTLLDRQWAHVVASDTHHPVRRPPRMQAAWDTIASTFSDADAHRVMIDIPGAIVHARLS